MSNNSKKNNQSKKKNQDKLFNVKNTNCDESKTQSVDNTKNEKPINKSESTEFEKWCNNLHISSKRSNLSDFLKVLALKEEDIKHRYATFYLTRYCLSLLFYMIQLITRLASFAFLMLLIFSFCFQLFILLPMAQTKLGIAPINCLETILFFAIAVVVCGIVSNVSRIQAIEISNELDINFITSFLSLLTTIIATIPIIIALWPKIQTAFSFFQTLMSIFRI